MTLTASITTHSDSTGVRRRVVEAGLVEFDGRNFGVFATDAKVFINGDLVGSHPDPGALYRELKAAKHAGGVNIQ